MGHQSLKARMAYTRVYDVAVVSMIKRKKTSRNAGSGRSQILPSSFTVIHSRGAP
jgi:hypothetical protein